MVGLVLALAGIWVLGRLPMGEASRPVALVLMLSAVALVALAPRIVRGRRNPL